jgi:hypothetical protein
MEPKPPEMSRASANRPESLLIGSAKRGDFGGVRAALAARPSMSTGLEMSGAFHAAVANRRHAMVAYLLDLGVDPNCLGPEPAIIRATRDGDVEMARLLLERGASPNAETFRESAVGKARFLGEKEVERLLVEAGGTSKSPRVRALRRLRGVALALAALCMAIAFAALLAWMASR